MGRPRVYAGIGSEKTPPEVEPVIQSVALHMNAAGFTLFSGAADGSDAMFERYSERAKIFLPWRGFNGHSSPHHYQPPRAFEIASTVHPAWDRLGPGQRKFHARNVLQILDETCDQPVALTCCWTPKGAAVGGTRTGIVLSERHDIPVFNLWGVDPLFGIPDLLKRIDAVIEARS